MTHPIEIMVADVKRMIDSQDEFALVDCREPDEFSIAHIAPAQLMPMSNLAACIGQLKGSEDLPIVVYCHHGGRSLRVAKWLREQGFPTAVSMAGGIDQWACQIDPQMPRY